MLLGNWLAQLKREAHCVRGRDRRIGLRRQIAAAIESLEDRTLLSSSPLLPDLVVLNSPAEGFLSGWELDTHSEAGKTLLRLTTAIANVGAGPLELHGGEADEHGLQEVTQHLLHNDGTASQQLAGAWGYHEAHGHTHFEAFAEYNLRRVNDDGSPGEVVAGGTKTSFALMDSRSFDLDLPNASEHSFYTECLLGAITEDCREVQGISVGWADVYGKHLPGQEIDVTDVLDGDYWLEIAVDPEQRIEESDELNNISRIRITLDRFDTTSDRALDSVMPEELGHVDQRTIDGDLAPDEQRLYRMQAAFDGLFTIELTYRNQSPEQQTLRFGTGSEPSLFVEGNRIDIDVEAGESLLVSLEGSSEPGDFTLSLTNLVGLANGVLVVHGTQRDDLIELGMGSDDPRNLSINGTSYNTAIFERFGSTIPTAIRISAAAGDDTVLIDPLVSLPAWINGEAGDDVLRGGRGNDLLLGGAGRDRLDGGAGADRLRGQGGNDSMAGGAGSDLLFGNAGADWLNGNSGPDTLLGGDGDDRLFGGAGADIIAGESGNDRIYGQGGRDRLAGGKGDDRFRNADGEVDESIRPRDFVPAGWSASTASAFDSRPDDGGRARIMRPVAGYLANHIVQFAAASHPLDLAALNGSNGFRLDGVDVADISGWSIRTAGDVNGDGFDDLLIGAPKADPGGDTNAGESYLVFGSGSDFAASFSLATLDGSNGFILLGIDAYDRSGNSVSSAGDMNGDGYHDILIGASMADPGGDSSAGETYLVFGSGESFPATADLETLNGTDGFRMKGIDQNDYSGRSVSTAGDVNGDGYDDILIGADGGDPGGSVESGESYVVFGSSTGFPASIDLATLDGSTGFRLDGVAENDTSGYSVSTAGDVNGDGYADILVGALFVDSGGSYAGSSYVVFGSGGSFAPSISLSSLDGSNGFRIDGIDSGDYSGVSVSDAGDINGDGFDDILVGAYSADPDGQSEAGESYVVFGSGSTFSAAVDLATLDGTNGFRLDGVDALDYSGEAVSMAGDINADGYDDIVIAASLADPGGNENAGEAYIVFGSGSSFPAALDLGSLNGTNGFRIEGIAAGDYASDSIGTAGDVNGDGFDDFLIGAWRASSAGESYLIFGDNFTYSATHRGTSSADNLTGRSIADVMVGGQADDTLTGGGGADVIYGAQGDDRIEIPDLDFHRLDGGRGTDTLALQGNGIDLDLSTIPDNKLRGFEAIDLTGDGNNSLTLTQLEVFNLSDTSNTLVVTGDTGDTLELGGGWTWHCQLTGPNVFTQGVATVIVDTQVTTTGWDSVEMFQLADLDGTGGFRIEGLTANDTLGVSLGTTGDVNGDGYDDLVIGVPGGDAGGSDAGETYVVFGSGTTSAPTLDLSALDGSNGFRIDGSTATDASGYSVSTAGDINGDGVQDILVGAYRGDPGGSSSAGESYIVFGRPSGTPFPASIDLDSLDGTDGFRIDGIDTDDFSGFSVATAGDLNGDGYSDILIGAPGGDPGTDPDTRSAAGETYVVFGSGASFPSTIDLSTLDGSDGFVIEGVDAGDDSGRSVSSAGDVNGDGYQDLLIGARGAFGNGSRDAGETYVVFGTGSGFAATLELSTLDGTDGFRLDGVDTDDFSGISVSTAGDVNGDGYDDIQIGAEMADPGGNSRAGETYLVYGTDSGFPASIDLSSLDGNNGYRLDGIAANDRSGHSVSAAGDVNGDGFDDMLIGAYGAGPGGTISAGETYLVFGAAVPATPSAVLDLSALACSNGMVFEGTSNVDESGRSVAAAGDINGDGYADILIGAPQADPGGTSNAGTAYVLYGGNCSGAVNLEGGSDDETLTGSSAADAIVAGAGNDRLEGAGGADVLYAAAGNDTITITDTTFARIDGGRGHDLVSLEGSGLTLDLTTTPENRFRGIEAIDLSGTGANSLVINRLEVLNLSDTSNTLILHGTSSDTATIGPGWTHAGFEFLTPPGSATEALYNVYTQDAATVKSSWALDVQPVNDPPVLEESLPEITTDEDIAVHGTGTDLTLEVTDADSVVADIQFRILNFAEISSDFGLTIGDDSQSDSFAARADNSLHVHPTLDFNGSTTVTIEARDAEGSVGYPRSFTLTITAVNDPPVLASLPAVTLDEDGSLHLVGTNLDSYVSDVDSDVSLIEYRVSNLAEIDADYGVSIGMAADSDSFADRTDNTIHVHPAADHNGTVTVEIEARDDAGAVSLPGSFTLSITPVNDPPVLAGLPDITIDEDGSVHTDGTYLDDYLTDVDSDLTTIEFQISNLLELDADFGITIDMASDSESFADRVDNRLHVHPAADHNGSTSVTVTARDAQGDLSESQQFTLLINPINDPPVAVPESYTGNENRQLEVPAPGVLGNDIDVEDDPLTAMLVNGVAHGSLSLATDGGFLYMPVGGYFGSDSFRYRAHDGSDAGNIVEVSLELIEHAEVEGEFFHDLDGDGVRGPDEPGLGGWTIIADTNGNGVLDEGETSVRTAVDDPLTPDVDEQGQWHFEDLVPGDYTLVWITPPGWQQGTASRDVSLLAGEVLSGILLADRYTCTATSRITTAPFDDDGADDLMAMTPVEAGGGITEIISGGNLWVRADLATINCLRFDGSADNDTLQVSLGGAAATTGLSEPISFDAAGAGSAGDRLELTDGSALEISYTLADADTGAISLDGRTISFSGVEPIDDRLVTPQRRFTLEGLDDRLSLTDGADFGGSDTDDVLRMGRGTADHGLWFPVPGDSLVVAAGAGDDTLEVLSLDVGFAAVLTLAGDAGHDLIDAPGAGVVVTINGGDGNDTLRGGVADDVINGDAGDDWVTGREGNDLLDAGTGSNILWESADVDYVLTDTTLTGLGSDTLLGIAEARLLGGNSPNHIDASSATIPVLLNGRAGDDTLLGGSGDDTLGGGAGADSIVAGPGHDRLMGQGSSLDSLTGGPGNDTIDGGEGYDHLIETADVDFTVTDTSLVGLGSDTLIGIELAQLFAGNSDNLLDGTLFSGRAFFNGKGGHDTLAGGSGHDRLFGGSGRDLVTGGDGHDVLRGQGGNYDTLLGEAGDDKLAGGNGHDSLDGGPGNDVLSGETGNDTLVGGSGNDRLYERGNVDMTLRASRMTGGLGSDVLSGFESAYLKGGNGANDIDAGSFTGSVTLVGLGGDDTLRGGTADDLINGRGGNDSLLGGAGHDTLMGYSGRDTLNGGTGNDTIDGGTDGDALSGWLGDDWLYGRSGDDTLVGGEGHDRLYGAVGRDILVGDDGTNATTHSRDDDRLNAGDGNDTVRGGGGTDIVTENPEEIDESFTYWAEWVDAV